ncbi:putative alanine racemase-domain-containing protein [Chiua virens]|nr:putative alanine racemase-domain-containing protein [Chiua virens]
MVAVQAIDEITDPRKVIQRIYGGGDHDIHRLPSAVTKHFSELFLSASDPHALYQLPSLDVFHPPESYTDGTLVRFRAMVQDTSLQNEVYLARLTDNRCGGWGIQPTHDEYSLNEINPDRLGIASVLWTVSVPGESPWRAAEISQPDSTSFPVHQSALPHKFPIPGATHIGVRVKLYTSGDVGNPRPADVITFVGILSSEPLSTEDDSSSEVPVLHVLCHQAASEIPTTTSANSSLRTELIDWISKEALGGDNDAAEWLLLQLTSKIHARAVPLLPPSLTISRFPQPSSPELLSTLSHVLVDLLPRYIVVPLSLDLLNKTPFLPESKEEDLHAGYLQLPLGTTVLLTENAIQEGQLIEKGILNVRAIQDVMDTQTVEYLFPFSNRFTFKTDLSMIVLSEGRQSAFFETSINFPLRRPSSDLYKPKNEISFPSVERLADYRSYISSCRAMIEKVQVTEETSKYIQDDFVRQRQQDKSMTPDELIHLMKVARLLAASRLQDEVTNDIWEQAKELDLRRQSC